MPALTLTIFLLSLLSLPQATQAADPENYCHDKKAAEQWETLAKKNTQDLDMQRLHALRLGICQKIEQGTLTTSDGINIFEKDREALALKWQQEKIMRRKKGVQ